MVIRHWPLTFAKVCVCVCVSVREQMLLMWRNSDSWFPQRVAGKRCRSSSAFAALWIHRPLRTSAAPVIPVKALNLHSAGQRRLWWFQGKPLRICKVSAGLALGGGGLEVEVWQQLLMLAPPHFALTNLSVLTSSIWLTCFFSSFHPHFSPPVPQSKLLILFDLTSSSRCPCPSAPPELLLSLRGGFLLQIHQDLSLALIGVSSYVFKEQHLQEKKQFWIL